MPFPSDKLTEAAAAAAAPDPELPTVPVSASKEEEEAWMVLPQKLQNFACGRAPLPHELHLRAALVEVIAPEEDLECSCSALC